MNFASGLHNMINSACTRQRDHSGLIYESDEFSYMPDTPESSARQSSPQQRPSLRQSTSSWRRKAVVAWKDSTGALRRINHRRNPNIPSGFEMVASRFSWIYITPRH